MYAMVRKNILAFLIVPLLLLANQQLIPNSLKVYAYQTWSGEIYYNITDESGALWGYIKAGQDPGSDSMDARFDTARFEFYNSDGKLQLISQYHPSDSWIMRLLMLDNQKFDYREPNGKLIGSSDSSFGDGGLGWSAFVVQIGSVQLPIYRFGRASRFELRQGEELLAQIQPDTTPMPRTVAQEIMVHFFAAIHKDEVVTATKQYQVYIAAPKGLEKLNDPKTFLLALFTTAFRFDLMLIDKELIFK